MNENQLAIYNQAGGHRAAVMTGGKWYSEGDNGMLLMLKCRGAKFNRVFIRLNALDTYDLEFLKIRPDYSTAKRRELSGIYCDQLRNIIESETGLYLSL